MEIKVVRDVMDEKRWDDFVRKNSSSTFYHQTGWKNVIERVYRHKPYYLYAENGGLVVGILPLFLIKDVIWGRRLVSLPFAPYGGYYTQDEATKRELLDEGCQLAKDLNARYIELRMQTSDPITVHFPQSNDYATYILNLSGGEDEVWRNLNDKRRNSIRKSIKSHIEIRNCEDCKYIDDFYNIYAHNMHDLGTPVHSYKFFIELITEFPNCSRTYLAYYKDKIVAGLLLLLTENHAIAGWAGSLDKYRHFAPNDLLYWEAIKYSITRGFTHFDFGRSLVGNGTAAYKKRWGANELILNYCYIPNSISYVPNINISNPRYRALARIWRTIPSSLAKRLGPLIRRVIV